MKLALKIKTRFKSLIKSFIPNKEVQITILDRSLYCRPLTDLYVYRIAMSHGLAPSHHELSSILSLMGFIGPGMTFVDVGANIGLFSVMFSSVGERVGFDVIAIEANPKTVSRLKRTLAPYSNCAVLECACSNRDGEGILMQTTSSMTAYLATEVNRERAIRWGATGECTPVKTMKLDTLLANHTRPLVVKIDVEGHEQEVIEGANTLLESGRIVALMIDGVGRVNVEQLVKWGYTGYNGRSLLQDKTAFNRLFVLTSKFPGMRVSSLPLTNFQFSCEETL
jgi:FkbM family methyltransferase